MLSPRKGIKTDGGKASKKAFPGRAWERGNLIKARVLILCCKYKNVKFCEIFNLIR
jgi:hypothetical protein